MSTWSQENPIYSYSVTVIPQIELAYNQQCTSCTVQLTLSYNTQYYVSVVATHPCGQSTSFTELYYYGECYNTRCNIINDLMLSKRTTLCKHNNLDKRPSNDHGT